MTRRSVPHRFSACETVPRSTARLHRVVGALLCAGGLAVWISHLGAAGTWVTETSLPSAIQETSSVAALNGQVYVVGGSVNGVRTNQTLAFDTAAHTWASRAPYPGAALDHASLAATGGFLYLIGGLTGYPQPSVATVQRYDPAANTWTSVAPLPVARAATGVAVINGLIYVAGGLVAGASVADFTVYNPSTNAWTTLPSMPTARDHLVGAALNGKFYAIGGRNSTNTCAPFRTVEVYDPATNAWTAGPPTVTAHAGHAVGQANGHIQVFGGDGNAVNCGLTAASEDFNPTTNAWTSLPAMPTPRHGTNGATVGNSVYVPGGGTGTSGSAPSAVNERFDATAQTLPAGWADQDIGTVGLSGGASFSNGQFTVVGEGTDIWGSADSFHFAYQSLGGDGQIVARVNSLTNTNAYAKAGVMFRTSLAADASHALLDVKPDGGIEFMTRAAAGGQTSFIAGAAASFPTWLRLARTGTTINAYTSADGATWTLLGTTTVNVGTTVYVGLAVTSHSSGTTATGRFDNVTVTGGGGTTDAAPVVSITSPASGASFAAPASIAIAATATDTDATPVARVDFYANNLLIGTATTSPYSYTWNNVAAGSYSLTAVATDTAGLAATSSAVNITVGSGSGGGGALPSPWIDIDVGAVGLAGSATYNGGTFTVKGAGSDIWGTSDSFNFVYQPLAGDGQIVARVASLQNTNTYAKAGVMIRQALDASSAQVILDVKPGGGVEFMSRPSGGGSVSFLASATGAAPVWLRLVRTGSNVVAYTSTNGSTWTTVGSTAITMPTSVYVGLAVCSHTTTALNTATFDNVSAGASSGGGDLPPSVSLTSPASGATFSAGATVSLAATASDGDATPVAKVDFYANNILVGTDTTSPYTFSWANVASGSYSLTAVATDTANLSATSSAVTITVGSGGGSGALPSPWVDADVGSTGLKGAATASNGVFTVKGAGADIWGTADSFNFVYQALTGDGQITARVASIQNTNQYAKAGVMIRQSLTADSPHVVLDLKAGGGYEFMTRPSAGATTNFLGGGNATAPIWLRLARNGNTVSGSTSTDGTTWTPLGDTTLTVNATVYVGMIVCSHDTTVLNTTTFDNVSVFVGSTAPPPTSSVSFTPKVLAVSGPATATAVSIPALYGPSSLTIGPDGKLYVSAVNGKIFILTIDQTKLTQANQVAVTNVQEIDDIYLKPSLTCNINGNPSNCQQLSPTGSGRLVTGIMIGTDSTATHTVLYVSNSNMSTTSGDMSVDTYSGTITRLILDRASTTTTSYTVTSNQDLVVGLPRSRDVHAVNGMSTGPDGWLYLAIGGNTNAGQPSAFFANLPEYYLSAAVLRLNLANLSGTSLPMDMHNVRTASDMSPFAGKFELYATGYRNPYDIVWHSNGRLYLNGNAANLTEGNTPGSSDGCSTPSISPGDQPDTLNIVTQGAYGGHPNPARGQCVWGDGTIYTPPLTPLSNYVRPITNYLAGSSTDGIAEYKSNAFSGAMQGNLITATYAGNQTVRRVILTADGSGVSSVESLGQFNQPLDVWPDQAGNIFIAEYGGNQITVLLPASLGSCPVPNSDPNVTDSDGDGYKDADETANGTDPCSAASVPPDADRDFVSDLLDTDDDNDGVADTQDQLYLDAQNGATTTMPVALEWNPTDPAYGKVAGSGFTGVQISSRASVDQASGHALVPAGIHPGDAGGHMVLWTYAGTAQGSANNQVNALQLGFDSSSAFRVWTRIVQPFSGATPADGHVGGAFFGPNEDNYARLAIVGTAGGGRALQFAVETAGSFTEVARLDVSNLTLDNLDLFIVGDAAAHTLSAYYDINITGTMTALSSAVAVPAGWFTNNSGSARNTSLAGLMVSNGSAAQIAFGYDFFRIDRNVSAPPPTAPTAPSNPSPANGATGVSTSTSLSWTASANANAYDIAFGTSNPPPLVASNQTTTSYTPSGLLTATTYYWQVTAKGSGGTTAGPVWNFTTGTTTAPAEIVIYASDIAAGGIHGAWSLTTDGTAAASAKLATPNSGYQQLNNPLASPTHYVDVTFTATANTPYRLWLRMNALSNNKFNDSLWVQFSDARANGASVYPINTTSGLLVNLATSSSGSSLNGWGWQNAAYWLTQPTTFTFPTTGLHTLRIQVREDGIAFDQIVLSPQKYLNAAPGPVSNDNTIVTK